MQIYKKNSFLSKTEGRDATFNSVKRTWHKI